MRTGIDAWQIKEGKLVHLDTAMRDAGRSEVEDLEKWILSNPMILGHNISIIGREVPTDSGKRIDILGVDDEGNSVIVELKRDIIPREALAQAIDYASDISDWTYDRLNEECERYNDGRSLEEQLNEDFDLEQEDLVDLSYNEAQRILFVGTSVENDLERMIEWLSTRYKVAMNVILLKYIQTEGGDEILARTVMISEEVEQAHTRSQRRRIPTPRSIKLGDEVIEIINVYDILVQTANWLLDQKALPDIPIMVSDRSGARRYLVNTEPIHPDGQDFRGVKELNNGLFIETSFNFERTVAMARRLLKKSGKSTDTLVLESSA